MSLNLAGSNLLKKLCSGSDIMPLPTRITTAGYVAVLNLFCQSSIGRCNIFKLNLASVTFFFNILFAQFDFLKSFLYQFISGRIFSFGLIAVLKNCLIRRPAIGKFFFLLPTGPGRAGADAAWNFSEEIINSF